jgi:hypothetical protein
MTLYRLSTKGKQMNLIEWSHINVHSIPSKSGVYAWYYRQKIGDKDVNVLIEKLNIVSDANEKKVIVEDFIVNFVFKFFKEDPYKIEISGPLKPSYKGEIDNIMPISSSMIDKIVAKPELIKSIQKTLNELSHEFFSPLYIGMSSNLSERITKHKSLIEYYTAHGVFGDHEGDLGDKNFASRVALRNFIPSQLMVVVKLVPIEDDLHNVVENILNRINYPILGRN